MALELLSSHACFGGEQRFYRHDSAQTGLPMRFSVYLPPHAVLGGARVPALVYLAGLTCTEETFAIKAGAQRYAAVAGLALVSPDTSPRGTGIAGEADDWEFGAGAGFYIDATREPWSRHFKMESWILRELLPLVGNELPIDSGRLGITGHSMGGHGALTFALRHPSLFKSLSAFAPICSPTRCPWGRKAFTGYIGPEGPPWLGHDATLLMEKRGKALFPDGILIDQGLADKFLTEQLQPELFEAACAKAGQPLTLRRHDGYDHGYYFVQTFMEDHVLHHARALC